MIHGFSDGNHKQGRQTKEKAASPGGKTAYLARLCIVQPFTTDVETRVEASGLRHPGAIGSRCWVVASEGTWGGASGVSIGVARP